MQQKLINIRDKIHEALKQHKELHEIDDRDVTQEFEYRSVKK